MHVFLHSFTVSHITIRWKNGVDKGKSNFDIDEAGGEKNNKFVEGQVCEVDVPVCFILVAICVSIFIW